VTERPRRFGLSKSKIAAFEQCPKRLWLSVHRPKLAIRDEGAEARFAVGHEVGAIACALLPDGFMVEAEPDLAAALETTRDLIRSGHDRPIFEATLEHEGVLVRVDILEPDGENGWRMAEVKSSTSAKDYHHGDLATQLWVARNAGVGISRAAIRHLDNSFVLASEGAFEGLFADAELMELVEPIIATRGEVVAAARDTLANDEPDIMPGDHCSKPFSCEFASHCRAALAEAPEWPITVLPSGGGKRWIERGVHDLFDVDSAELTSAVHRRVHHATVTGEPYHDVAGARTAIDAWAFPRTWLDFETIGFAVPRWIGTKPYQQVPFQFSAHVEAQDGAIDHREFLSLDGVDPRRACAEALVALLPAEGTIIGYNASFEKGRIKELANAFPDLAGALHAMAGRVVDLLAVTRACWYHCDQRGSWSIKAVLPTVARDLDYSGLEVKDGGNAQMAYMEAIAPETDDGRRAAIEAALKAYCARDTEAMIVLARHLCGGNG